jgi:hypothetical protein
MRPAFISHPLVCRTGKLAAADLPIPGGRVMAAGDLSQPRGGDASHLLQ